MPQVPITDTATPVSAYAGKAGRHIAVRNIGTNTIWLGYTAVTPTTGYPLLTMESIDIPLRDDTLYAVTETGQNGRVAILESDL